MRGTFLYNSFINLFLLCLYNSVSLYISIYLSVSLLFSCSLSFLCPPLSLSLWPNICPLLFLSPSLYLYIYLSLCLSLVFLVLALFSSSPSLYTSLSLTYESCLFSLSASSLLSLSYSLFLFLSYSFFLSLSLFQLKRIGQLKKRWKSTYPNIQICVKYVSCENLVGFLTLSLLFFISTCYYWAVQYQYHSSYLPVHTISYHSSCLPVSLV